MKILMFKESLTVRGGGAERVFACLTNDWKARNVDIQIMTFDDPGSESFFELHEDIPWHRISNEQIQKVPVPSQLWKRILLLRRMIKMETPDILLSFGDTVNGLAVLAGKLTGTKVIIAERNNPSRKEMPQRLQKYRRWLYPYCDALVVQTEGVKKEYSKKLLPKIRVIPNPVLEVKAEVPIGCSVRPRLELLTVAKLLPQKGLDTLLRALHQVLKSNKGWHLTILGEGPLRQPLEAQVKEAGLQDYVSMPGIQRNVLSWYSQSDCFVLSSRFEGYPNALLEAMSCGLPVIATRCPYGPGEMIESGENGILVDVDNSGQLSQAILELLNQDSLRYTLGIRARKSVERNSLTSISDQWLKLIEET